MLVSVGGEVDEVGPGSARNWDPLGMEAHCWDDSDRRSKITGKRESSAPSVFILQILILGPLDPRAPQFV